MIATFIYTECQKPGPFKAEPGFKIKDVKLWKTGDDRIFHQKITSSNSADIEKLVMEAVGSLPSFEPPTMSPFITQADFLQLEKQWIYFRLASGYLLFARMSTSGFTHGRRGNPFHMGILFDNSSLQSMLKFWRKASQKRQLYVPGDLFTWTGWQDPRTAEDLEKAELTSDQFPMPALMQKTRFIEDRNYINQHRSEIRTALVAIENSYNKHVPAEFGAEDSWNFMKQVDIATLFLPTSLAWSTNISSTASTPDFKGKDRWSRGILHGFAGPKTPSPSSWVSVAMHVLDNDLFNEIEPLMYVLCQGILWTSTNGSGGLWHLPLAVLLRSAQVPDLFPRDVLENCFQLSMHHWPDNQVMIVSQTLKDSIVNFINSLDWLNPTQHQELSNKIQSLPVR